MAANGAGQFPFHGEGLERLRRIDGQLHGIMRMLEQRRYCMDILQQLTAARRAMDQVALQIIRNHINSCVRDAIQKSRRGTEKVEELMRALNRFVK